MKPELLARAMDVFEAVCDLDAGARDERANELCGQDTELRALVQSLIDGDQDPLTCFDSVELVTSFHEGVPDESGEMPEYVGRYRILEVLGSGGMGIVYKAQQKLPRRWVALKVIRPQFVTGDYLRQFEYEAQVLGLLGEHPGVAPVFDAGTATTPRGPVPFIVMDLIEGEPLTKFARSHALSLRDRVELLAKIADAVHHAHKQRIVHRDLKPANILVKADGNPKVVDFGIACSANVPSSDLLGARGLIGTLPYMSPEQCSGERERINIESDVYSLGVVGYELLSGRMPYDVSGDVAEIKQTIAATPPAPLPIDERWNAEDLRAVLAKALAKDPAQRYDAASALARDLRRWLEYRPVDAHEPGKLYRSRLAVRRNRALSAVVAGLLVVLVLGIVGTSRNAIAAEKAAAEAELEARNKNAANEFLEEVFNFAQPAGARGEDVSMSAALDRAARRVDRALRDDPIVRAYVHGVIGRCYTGLGVYDRAKTHLESARDTLQAARGSSHPDALAATAACFSLDAIRGEIEGTVQGLDRVHRQLQAEAGERDERTLRVGHDLAEALYLASDYARAESVLSTIVQLRGQVLGEDHQDTLVSLAARANVLAVLGRFDEAQPLFQTSLEGLRAQLGEDHPDYATTLNNWAGLLYDLGDNEKALEYMRVELDLSRRTHGEEHPLVQTSRSNVAIVLMELGRYDEAEQLLDEAISNLEATVLPSHEGLLRARHNRGDLYCRQERWEEAERELSSVLEDRQVALGATHDETLLSVNYLADALKVTGRYEDAIAVYERSVESLAAAEEAPRLFHGVFLKELGVCHMAIDERSRAETRFLESLAVLDVEDEHQSQTALSAMTNLIAIYDQAGDKQNAELFRRQYEELRRR